MIGKNQPNENVINLCSSFFNGPLASNTEILYKCQNVCKKFKRKSYNENTHTHTHTGSTRTKIIIWCKSNKEPCKIENCKKIQSI